MAETRCSDAEEARAVARVPARFTSEEKMAGSPCAWIHPAALWSGGRVVRYQGTLVDITEKHALEQQLRRQEEFRRHLLESFPDLILVLDLNGQLHIRERRASPNSSATAQNI